MSSALRVTARSVEGEVMAVAHERYPTLGVQYHPESLLTDGGHALLRNFIGIATCWWGTHAPKPRVAYPGRISNRCELARGDELGH